MREEIVCADDSTLCLSLDWSTRRHSTPEYVYANAAHVVGDPDHVFMHDSPASLVVSLSNGEICLLGGETQLEMTSRWHAHDFEPWIAAFDCWDPSTVWTGGDDLKLKGWDLRQGCEQPTFVNKRT